MITQSIEYHKAPVVVPPKQEKKRYDGEMGTDDHKRFIYRRARRECKWNEFEYLLYRRNPVYICGIYEEDEYHNIQWDGLKPKFIEIYDKSRPVGEDFLMVHPSDLKRQRK